MKYEVFRERNSKLEVHVTVMNNRSDNLTDIKTSEDINHGLVTFRLKHLSFSDHEYEDEEKYNNIVLIGIEKNYINDKLIHRIKVNCPEFYIKDHLFYCDESKWRVLDENNNIDAYEFTVKFEVETLAQIQFSTLCDDEHLTDFLLKGEDGEIKIHKVLLAAISEVFKSKLLNGNELENENRVSLHIPGTSVKTLQNFKRCIYNEAQALPDENVEELLLLASYLKIKWLEYKCVEVLITKKCSSELVHLLEFALEHRSTLLFIGIMEQVQSGNLKINDIREQYLKQ